jgi:hypothetical protein
MDKNNLTLTNLNTTDDGRQMADKADNRQMDRWTDRQMNGGRQTAGGGRWTDGLTDGRWRTADRWTDGPMDQQTNGGRRTGRPTDRQTDGRTHGRTDRCTDGQTDVQTDRCTDGRRWTNRLTDNRPMDQPNRRQGHENVQQVRLVVCQFISS